ncbi:UDP-glucose 4-epimerase GalE [Verrucomicrobia bacterium LW23]|nr:UDP-glucose 4-epimerase GalE [Verrucomicrobia bacterium LW23]
MKILVTGGAGYIGSICTEEILNLGDSVVVFDNLTEGHRSAIDPRAKFVEGDLGDRDFIFKTLAEEKPDAVMHFAANALVGESMTNPSKYFRNNVAYGINLIDAMVDAGVKQFVFSSTCATYGVPERVPIDERNPQRPINPYGESKLMFEHVLKWYEKIHGLVHVNLRYFNAAGASERFGEDHRIETHLIPNVLKVALGQRERVDIFGDRYDTPDGTCIRDYIHVKDLAAAHLLAIGAKHSASYNLGTGEGFSVQQVVDAARKVTGHAIPAVVKEARAGDPARLISSSLKITAELGWKPKLQRIQPILESAWAWHSKNPNGYGD